MVSLRPKSCASLGQGGEYRCLGGSVLALRERPAKVFEALEALLLDLHELRIPAEPFDETRVWRLLATFDEQRESRPAEESCKLEDSREFLADLLHPSVATVGDDFLCTSRQRNVLVRIGFPLLLGSACRRRDRVLELSDCVDNGVMDFHLEP